MTVPKKLKATQKSKPEKAPRISQKKKNSLNQKNSKEKKKKKKNLYSTTKRGNFGRGAQPRDGVLKFLRPRTEQRVYNAAQRCGKHWICFSGWCEEIWLPYEFLMLFVTLVFFHWWRSVYFSAKLSLYTSLQWFWEGTVQTIIRWFQAFLEDERRREENLRRGLIWWKKSWNTK